MIRLLIVEDQPDVRKGLHMRLNAEADLAVIGEAVSGEAALVLAPLLRPDVVLMDVEMPRMDGITATKELHLILPGTAIIISTIYDDARTRARAQEAGAAAFITKSMPVTMLLAAIRQVAQTSSAQAKE
jgi:DNA-binding NarL/FixJ family response regulator